MRGFSFVALIVCLSCVARSAAAQAANLVVVPPHAISATDVAYPDDARGDADVVLELSIDATGHVQSAKAISGAEPFLANALRAAPSWQFDPALRNGHAVAARVRFGIHFSAPAQPPAPPAPEASNALPAHPDEKPEPARKPKETAPPIVLTVQGEREEQARTFSSAEVRQLPGAFGDPFRAIEALPGVTPIASGAPYFYVRGAPPGNVGYYFDGVRVPVLFHAAAGPSVIHPAFVDNVKLYSGGYPARYGRFAGGIVTADAVEPEQRVHGQASVRLVDAGAMLEVPFAGGRGDAQLAGRYSYTAAVVSAIEPRVSLAYWDYQSRVSYALGARDRVSMLAFGSLDSVAQVRTDGSKDNIYATRFHRFDLRYDRRVSDTGNLRVAATLGTDRSLGPDESYTVQDTLYGGRVEYQDRLSSALELEAGADANFDRYDLARATVGSVSSHLPAGSNTLVLGLSPHDDVVAGAYLGLNADASKSVSVSPGLRFDVYQSAGSSAYAIEPRVSARYRVSKRVTLLDDFGVAHQLPSFVAPIAGLQPSLAGGLQLAVQSSSGIELELPEDTRATLTAFQTALFNGTDRLGVVRLKAESTLDLRTLGESQGLEFMLERKLSKSFGGFVSYTLSRSRRALLESEGPSAFDRTHVLNLALTWNLGRRWRAGARTMLYSGIPAQVPYATAARHPPRTAPFYRFDWRLEKRWQISENAYWAFVLEVLNTTLHREVLSESCTVFRCHEAQFGPVTVPSIGVEAGF